MTTVEQRLANQIGNLAVENAKLVAAYEAALAQIDDMKGKLEAVKAEFEKLKARTGAANVVQLEAAE